jgi:RHH-type proline utilization regulon transcriptional repressor/proline dehydrogenase/delta 1-pyrroline-5-carboxylate dehydrogenase
VVAKPAEQTTAIAAWLAEQARQAGLPAGALHLLNARRETMTEVIACPWLAGLSFTGSLNTAKRISQQLAQRPGAILPLIAETGGMNVMVVDSSALLEQSCDHILESAFNQAGQRCSALRILYVQQEVAPRLLELITGGVAELKLGQPGRLDTDIGPLIDHTAKDKLIAQWEHLKTLGTVLVEPSMALGTDSLPWFTPAIIEMQTPFHGEELFGPVLQIVRYRAQDFDQVLAQISDMPWGLTVGLQSRIDERIEKMADLPIGNLYVNRPMIGATVGVQPFGGQGASGTGPKAGGPNTLKAHCTERVISVNTASSGATVELLTLSPDPVKIANRFNTDT